MALLHYMQLDGQDFDPLGLSESIKKKRLVHVSEIVQFANDKWNLLGP